MMTCGVKPRPKRCPERYDPIGRLQIEFRPTDVDLDPASDTALVQAGYAAVTTITGVRATARQIGLDGRKERIVIEQVVQARQHRLELQLQRRQQGEEVDSGIAVA